MQSRRRLADRRSAVDVESGDQQLTQPPGQPANGAALGCPIRGPNLLPQVERAARVPASHRVDDPEHLFFAMMSDQRLDIVGGDGGSRADVNRELGHLGVQESKLVADQPPQEPGRMPFQPFVVLALRLIDEPSIHARAARRFTLVRRADASNPLVSEGDGQDSEERASA